MKIARKVFFLFGTFLGVLAIVTNVVVLLSGSHHYWSAIIHIIVGIIITYYSFSRLSSRVTIP